METPARHGDWGPGQDGDGDPGQGSAGDRSQVRDRASRLDRETDGEEGAPDSSDHEREAIRDRLGALGYL